VLEAVESSRELVVHGDVDVAFVVVPFKVETAVEIARPVNCAFVV
jgi:hypothetical protein